jgi:hypothetical protein
MYRLPPFSEFLSQLNVDSFSYDIAQFAPEDLKDSSDLFAEEQYAFLMKSYSAMALALLQSYHLWLRETLSPSNQ